MGGRVIWITGLSGSGKSTIARQVVHLFRVRGEAALLVDGDEIREAVNDVTTGYDWDSRLKNAYRICRLARLFARQELTVVVATMSLFHEVHAWNRQNLPGYIEVMIEVPEAVLQRRDERGLYRRALRGEARHVVGVELRHESPLNPDLVLDNSVDRPDVTDLAARIVAFVDKQDTDPRVSSSSSIPPTASKGS